MKLTPILLIFAAGAFTALSAGSIGNASVETSAQLPLPSDFCQQSASRTSISIGCESFRGQVAVAGASATVVVSFGNLSVTASAGGLCCVAEARASASYDEFLLFGNASMPITGEYTFGVDAAFAGGSFTIYQGDAVFQFNPNFTPYPLFLTSNYVANVPMEVSATALAVASTPGTEFSLVDLNLIGFSAPYTAISTPEPSSLLLACIGMGLVVGWKVQKNFAGELRQGARCVLFR